MIDSVRYDVRCENGWFKYRYRYEWMRTRYTIVSYKAKSLQQQATSTDLKTKKHGASCVLFVDFKHHRYYRYNYRVVVLVLYAGIPINQMGGLGEE